MDEKELISHLDKIPTGEIKPVKKRPARQRQERYDPSPNWYPKDTPLPPRAAPDPSLEGWPKLKPHLRRGAPPEKEEDKLDRQLAIYNQMIEEFDNITQRRELLRASLVNYEQMMLTGNVPGAKLSVMQNRFERYSYEKHGGLTFGEMDAALRGEYPRVSISLSREELSVLYLALNKCSFAPATTWHESEYHILQKIGVLYDKHVRGLSKIEPVDERANTSNNPATS